MIKDYIYRSYDKNYIDQVKRSMGDMMQYACLDNHYNPDSFFKMFLDSGIARKIEIGDTSIIAGKSGIEIADMVFEANGLEAMFEPVWDNSYSEYYWAGYMLALYQWYTSKRFEDIWKYMSITKLLSRYEKLHQINYMYALDEIDEMVKNENKLPLNILRIARGLSQVQLAKRANMDISQIQRLEYGERKVENLTLKTAINLANALNVDVKDIA